ncbi:MAG: hypothetical protein EBZ48_06630 [Proteobacteria bacterium]|nr:hypothetical protein [Pseudomonadota bacterium]
MAHTQHTLIRDQILKALGHPEAEDGLYFRNFFHLHEEDERQVVSGEQSEILAVLEQLVAEGLVRVTPNTPLQEEAIFSLA